MASTVDRKRMKELLKASGLKKAEVWAMREGGRGVTCHSLRERSSLEYWVLRVVEILQVNSPFMGFHGTKETS